MNHASVPTILHIRVLPDEGNLPLEFFRKKDVVCVEAGDPFVSSLLEPAISR